MRLTIATAFLLFLYSCAQVGSIGGGPKDETPPQVLASNPKNKTLNFNYKTATVQFDEYIQLRSLSKELIISPALDPKPTVKIKKKSLVIDFSECTLAENTTYVLNFGNAIVDNNENNKLENFNYVFSTGSYIDSFHISGTVTNSLLGKPAKDAYVMLYNNLSDTAVYTTKPYYFSKTNDAGEYSLNNLKAGTYQIIALQDANSNFKFDQKTEAIGFLDAPIELTEGIDNLQLATFIEKDTLQYIKRVKHLSKERIDIVMYQQTDSISITSATPFWDYLEVNKTNDSLTLWYTNYNDSAIVILNDYTFGLLDTLTIPSQPQPTKRERNKEKYASYKSNINGNKLDLNKPVQLTFNIPVITIDTSKIQLFSKDTIPVNFEIISTESNRIIELISELKPDSSYILIIDSVAFLGIDSTINTKNDTINFRIKNKEDYGKLILKIDSLKPETNYVFQLTTSNKQVIQQIKLNNDTTLTFDLLQPTTYNFILIEDNNNNGKWDTGNFLKKQNPERIITYPTTQTIRANWDLEIDWKIQ